MAKGKRKAINPVQKLQAQLTLLGNICESIIENGAKPEFAASMVELQKQIDTTAAQKTKLNSKGRVIMKFVKSYPGLSGQFLSLIRGKISEYKELGLLEKYKVESTEEKTDKTDKTATK